MKFVRKSKAYSVFDWLPDSSFLIFSKYILKNSNITLAENLPDSWIFVRDKLIEYDCRTTLEFGGGRHLAINQWLTSWLEQQRVIDLSRMIDPSAVLDANTALKSFGHIGSEQVIQNYSELEKLGIIYDAPRDLLELPEDAKFDANVSVSTWEHIPKNLIPRMLGKLRKLIHPNGVVIAYIDYSDHYSHSDNTIDRTHFLAYSEKEWAKHQHKHLFQNRLRHKNYQDIFEKCGFEILYSLATNYVQDPKLMPLDENLTGDATDLATTGYWVIRPIS